MRLNDIRNQQSTFEAECNYALRRVRQVVINIRTSGRPPKIGSLGAGQ